MSTGRLTTSVFASVTVVITLMAACSSQDRASRPDSTTTPAAAPVAAAPPAAAPATSAPSPPPRITAAEAAARDSVRQLVTPMEIPASVRQACDSAAAFVGSALRTAARRQDGQYFDHFRGDQRVGCRVTAGSHRYGIGQPFEHVDSVFAAHRWNDDMRWQADGSGGTNGRHWRGVLCVVIGEGAEHDDSDTLPHPEDTLDVVYDATVECFQDSQSNTEKDSSVPDSLWSIAEAAGLDSLYAISLSHQAPPYWEGDFDGDRIRDVAVLVENRANDKLGLVMIHRGTRRVIVLAAGAGAPGPDDLFHLETVEPFGRDVTINTVVPGRPFMPLRGDALWVQTRELRGFYIWIGNAYLWEPHPEKP